MLPIPNRSWPGKLFVSSRPRGGDWLSDEIERWRQGGIQTALSLLTQEEESELGILSSQCLSRRIPDKQTLLREVAAWQDHRNKHHAKADWQFTTDDARVKLKRLYPSF